MNSSENLNELATALAKAQGAMKGALKDSNNPFFKSKYADLESVWESCRKHLTENGLSVIQYGEWRPIHATAEGAWGPILITRLLHSSGQWIEGSFMIKAKDDSPQAQGSGITYARRYGLAAMVGVYQTDDDAEAAQGRVTAHSDTTAVDPLLAEKIADAFRTQMNVNNDRGVYQVHLDASQEGEEAYDAAWKLLKSGERATIKRIIDDQKAKF